MRFCVEALQAPQSTPLNDLSGCAARKAKARMRDAPKAKRLCATDLWPGGRVHARRADTAIPQIVILGEHHIVVGSLGKKALLRRRDTGRLKEAGVLGISHGDSIGEGQDGCMAHRLAWKRTVTIDSTDPGGANRKRAQMPGTEPR